MWRVLKYLWPRSRWDWFIRGGIGFLVMNVVAVELTSQSWFCNSCHIMNTYHASWSRSTHSKIECVQCHIPPGVTNFVSAKLNGAGQVVDDLLSRTSTKPSAQVSDASCTRSGCHELAKVRATVRKKGKYLFDHGKHLGLEHSGIQVNCTTCHSHVKGMNHFEVNTNACLTCHLGGETAPPALKAADHTTARGRPAPLDAAQLASTELVATMVATAPATSQPAKTMTAAAPPRDCRKCHEPPGAVITYRGLTVNHAEYLSYGAACESCHSGVTERPRRIRDDACFSCHEFGMERLGSTEETHRVHSTGRHKVECFSCHGELRHGPAAQSMQLAEVDCKSCHQSQHAVQQKTYATMEAPAHVPANATAVSPMFLVHVSCGGCHVEPRPVSTKPDSGSTVMGATARACDSCHKPGSGEQVALWQRSTRQLYDGVMKMMPPASRALTPAQERLAREAQSLLDVVRMDGSWGVHNPRYTQRLLEQAQEKLVAIGKPSAAREAGQ